MRRVAIISAGATALLVLLTQTASATTGDRFREREEINAGKKDDVIHVESTLRQRTGRFAEHNGHASVLGPSALLLRALLERVRVQILLGGPREKIRGASEAADEAARIIREHEERYGEDSEYEDHNIGREDEGSWWRARPNPDHPDGGSTLTCNAGIFWVDYDDTPPDLPGAITTELLAELAYAEVEIPQPEAELSPAADAQKVNLDTWVWMDASDLAPVSVTASVDGYASPSATVTATPVRVELDPGTNGATVHGGGEGCTVGTDGGAGRPYTSGDADRTPACAVTYHRATHHRDPYPFAATVIWEVSWEGSDGSGDALPDGAFGTTQEVTVDEVQTVVR